MATPTKSKVWTPMNPHPLEGKVDCSCGLGQKAQLLTTRTNKHGNEGRQFFKCARDDAKCSFFKWADELSGPGAPAVNPSSVRTPQSSQSSGASGSMTAAGSDAGSAPAVPQTPSRNRGSNGAATLATPARTPSTRTAEEKARRLAQIEKSIKDQNAASSAASTYHSEAPTLSQISVGSTQQHYPESIEEDDEMFQPSLAEPSPAAFMFRNSRQSNPIPSATVASSSETALGKRRRVEEDDEENPFLVAPSSSQSSRPTPSRAAVPGTSKLAQFERRLQAREQQDERMTQMIANQAAMIANQAEVIEGLQEDVRIAKAKSRQQQQEIERLQNKLNAMEGQLELHRNALFEDA